MAFFKQTEEQEQIQTIFERLAQLDKRIETMQTAHNVILEQINKMLLDDNQVSKYNGRIEDLELWRAKVHALMVEKSPIKKTEKISKFGFSTLSRI